MNEMNEINNVNEVRDEGWYWATFEGNKWGVVYYTKGDYYIAGSDGLYEEKDFKEIIGPLIPPVDGIPYVQKIKN